jgi:tetratricopeptide (TPR) repeat protein
VKQSAQQLRDEIVLREASLADVRRERAAGELSVVDAATIEAREDLALRRARAQLELLGDEGSQKTGRRRRRSLLWVGFGSFFLVLVIVLWSSILLRQPGTSDTGSVTLGAQQEVTQLLDEAQTDVADGHFTTALNAYQQVLALSPKNAPALTEVGWLDFSAGSSDTNPALVALGIKDLQKAIKYAPRYPAARLYYALVADSTPHNESIAKSEFRVFLALHPSKAQLALAAPFLKQLGIRASN